MRKIARRIGWGFLSLILLLCLLILVSGKTYLFKAAWYNFADIDDYKIFSNDTVRVGKAQPWPVSQGYSQTQIPANLKALLESLQTIGVVVIKNDSLLFEEYWDGYGDDSYSNSFSVAKSITSLLMGAAIKEGRIHSVEDPVGNYLPEFKDGDKASIRIVDLLTMSSGSDWDESYSNPLSTTTELYYGSDVTRPAEGVKIIQKPGSYHSYKSGDSQLLGLLLEKVTGKSLSEYASEKLWQPLGAEHAALWSTDKKDGHIKAYCCFNTNARDFARLGQLMLDSGRWNGTSVIDSGYYSKSIAPCLIPDEVGRPCNYYGYQWWLVPYQPGVFYARGILGQYIIVIPSKKEVIVRLGKHRSPKIIQTVPEEVDELIKWGLSF